MKNAEHFVTWYILTHFVWRHNFVLIVVCVCIQDSAICEGRVCKGNIKQGKLPHHSDIRLSNTTAKTTCWLINIKMAYSTFGLYCYCSGAKNYKIMNSAVHRTLTSHSHRPFWVYQPNGLMINVHKQFCITSLYQTRKACAMNILLYLLSATCHSVV